MPGRSRLTMAELQRSPRLLTDWSGAAGEVGSLSQPTLLDCQRFAHESNCGNFTAAVIFSEVIPAAILNGFRIAHGTS